MSSTSRFKRPKKRSKARILTYEKLEEWLATREHPMPGVPMIDGYLAALVVSPQFIPPEDWLRPIVGDGIAWAPDGSIEEAVRNTIFQRYNQIGAALSGGAKRYAPIYMRTDDGEVLLEDFANGFYLGMRLSIDDWKPHISNPEIGHPLTAILGHCTTMMPEDQRQNALRGQAGEILAQSWKVVPELDASKNCRILVSDGGTDVRAGFGSIFLGDFMSPLPLGGGFCIKQAQYAPRARRGAGNYRQGWPYRS